MASLCSGPAQAARDPDDEGVALAAAAAERRRADAAAATLELERQVQGDPGAGHADRVPQGDRAAVDVDLVGVEAELLGRGQPDRRERLVDLDQVEVGGRDALLVAGLGDRARRLALQRGVRARRRRRARRSRPARSGRAPRALALLITTTAAAPSEICDADPAVMVPSLLNAGRSRARLSVVVSARMPSSVAELQRLALALRDRDGDDLVVEHARPSTPWPRAGGSARRTRPAPRGRTRRRRRWPPRSARPSPGR